MTTVRVIVEFEGDVVPPVGAPVIIQLRDTSLQDAPAVVLGEVRGRWPTADPSQIRGAFEVSSAQPCDHATVWAHIDVDGDGRVSRGDYTTVRSYPVAASPTPVMHLRLKRV